MSVSCVLELFPLVQQYLCHTSKWLIRYSVLSNYFYSIDKDRIGTKHALKSVKTYENNEADWSKALKYMLTNLKRILGYVPVISSTMQ